MIGHTISHYRVIDKLGGDGTWVVYKAEGTRLHCFGALKFLPEHVARHPHARSRFRREAQAPSAVNHPNIYTIHDIVEQDRDAFIALEFLEARRSSTAIKVSGRSLYSQSPESQRKLRVHFDQSARDATGSHRGFSR